MLDSFEKNSESFFVLKKPTAASKAGALHYFLQKVPYSQEERPFLLFQKRISG